MKETNLFFAIDNLLDLFGDAPIVVLSRSPVGIASSFGRGRLFERWGYRDRYSQLEATVSRPGFAAYRCVLPDDRPDGLRMLTRMIVLNALLLAGALGHRRFGQVAYERAVVDQASAVADAARLLGRQRFAFSDDTGLHRTPLGAVDDTYATRQVGARVLHLDSAEIRVVRQEVETRLSAAIELPGAVVDRATAWLSADPGAAGARRPRSGTIRPPEATERVATGAAQMEARFKHRGATPGRLWRTTLVTNGEFRAFLDDMRHAGIPNLIGATTLFCNDAMSHERGGRIHPDPAGDGHMVSAGYEGYPVYWVTWIGAAAFARWAGARLPTRVEIDRLATAMPVDLAGINADYRIGDVIPAGTEAPIGNLQVWCHDGPAPLAGIGPANRYLYGAAWNTPATWADIRQMRSRHITGCSRGVGIQLVTTAHRPSHRHPASSIAQDLHRALEHLRNRHQSFAALDDELIRAVTSRAEGGGHSG